MLNQSFSYDNFKTIFEIENRKARFNVNFLEKSYLRITDEITDFKWITREKIRDGIDDDELEQRNSELLELENQRDKMLETYLYDISTRINDSSFKIKLRQFFDNDSSKFIYTLEKNVESFLVMKQLQFNLKKTFNVKPSDRHHIVKQLKGVFEDNFPKYVVRTDIKSFYESVPQERLTQLLLNNSLLSPQSLKLIKNIFYEYNLFTNQLALDKNSRVGIPRGIGISAYLSELFMRSIDDKIKQLDFVSYYARYVDDIIVVFNPPFKNDTKDYFLDKIRAIIALEGLQVNIKADDGLIYKYNALLKTPVLDSEKIYQVAKLSNENVNYVSEESKEYFQLINEQIYSVGLPALERVEEIERIVSKEILKIDNNKTFQTNLFQSGTNLNLSFLGYKFIFNNSQFSDIQLSDRKIVKYKTRILQLLESFMAHRVYNYADARKLLISRLSYLTSNTQLVRPKKGYIGIYYSNSLVNSNCVSLLELDVILADYLSRYLNSPNDIKLLSRLKHFSFVKGFENKMYYNLATKKLPKMLDKSGNYLKTNFEKIVYIWN